MPLREQWPYPGREASLECLAEQDFEPDAAYQCASRIRALGFPGRWRCTRPRCHVGAHVGHFPSGMVCARWADADMER